MFYKPLTQPEIRQIVDILLSELNARLEDKELKVELTDAAKDYIADIGFDPVYGARPLKRALQSKVENLVARLIIMNDIAPESTIEIDAEGEELKANIK